MGNLRRQNANDATGTFNRSRNVAPMSWLCTRFNSCKGDVRSGWHRSEREKSLNTPLCWSVKKHIKIKREGRKKWLWQKGDSRYAAIVERVRRS